MFKTVRDAFKVKDIRQRLLYTFLMLIIVRIGCQLPMPGTTQESIKAATSGMGALKNLGFFSALTGGSFEQGSIFALNITPYITSSIIIQLLTIAIPALEEMQKDGEEGRKKIQNITRYVTVALALIQATATVISFGNQGLFGNAYTFSLKNKHDLFAVIVAVMALTAGSAFLMWMGENITEKGVGNGISVILLVNIVSRMPSDVQTLYQQFVKTPSSIGGKLLSAVVIVAIVVVIVAFVVVLQDAERRIPVQYSKKVQGRKLVGGQSSHIPLKVNTAGVIPIIFAQSLLMFPVVICQFIGKSPEWAKYLQQNYWCRFNTPSQIKYSIGFIVYIALVIAFAYFYTSITFNPIEVADNMKKSGGFIPGIRPGKPTQDYLNNLLNYIVLIGAIGLLIVAVIPIAAEGLSGAQIAMGGTSLIIVVGVVLETIKNIESKMVVRSYKGFLID